MSLTKILRIAHRCLAVTVLGLMTSFASGQEITPPDAPGPFNVGVTTFSATMTDGRLTRIQVYYPTLEPADEEFRYTILAPFGSYQLSSPLFAVENAQAAPGRFPLIVYDHGGTGAGADSQRVAQLPLHETLASQGFVIAVALHSADAATRVRDLSVVIDVMLARSATVGDLLTDSIDPNKIGISGHSAGGAAAIGAAGGWAANGIVADSRIRTMLVYEPSILSLDDASTIAIPYLVMGGTQSRFSLDSSSLFDATELAAPRIYVLNPNAAHFNYVTGMCSEINETREVALLADETLREPLTHLIAGSAGAFRANNLWRQGEALFPTNGYGMGGGRNFCTRVGVNSVRSLDTNPQDGFTDSPPFMATDAFTLVPPIPDEVMVPLIKVYTTAFWKTFLDGDHRYMRYLTPGYAKSNDLPASVKIQG